MEPQIGLLLVMGSTKIG